MESSITTVFNDTNTGQTVVCVKNDRTVGSLGVWIGDNPFDFLVPVTLCQIIIFSLISRGLHYVLRPIHTPKFVCCVIVGVLLGPTFLDSEGAIRGTLFPAKQASLLNTMSKIATVYCVFITCLKMDVVTTLKAAKRCWRFGVFPFFSSFFLTVTLLTVYSPPGADSMSTDLNFPNVFTVSSFAVVHEALTELNLVATELGQIALSSAMVSEILQWFTMELQFNNSNATKQFTLILLISVCVFAVICLCIVRPLVNLVVERTPRGRPVREVHLVMLLLGPLVMAAISDIIGVYFVMGPLLYGLVLPNGPPIATTIIERSQLLITEFLMPFFFLYIGSRTDLTTIPKHWKVALIFQSILFVGFLVKVLACVLISPTYKFKLKHGLALGLILNVKGTVELIFYNRMNKLGVIDREVFSVAVMYVVFITSVCVPLIKSLYRHRRVCKTPTIHEGRLRTIQTILEKAQFNIVSCVHTDEHVHSMIALIEACNPTIESPIFIYVVHLIELLGKSTPILLPMNKQNRKTLAVNYPNTNRILRAFKNYSDNSSGPVTIHSYVNVAPYKSMHEAVCNLAEDNSVHFLIIPFHQNDHQTLGSHEASTIRNLNTNFLATAKATVGVLVDRYSVLSGSSSKLSFHVGVFFLGGKDDREALALGIRMLERPNTRVTLFRFVLPNKEGSGFVIYGFVEKEEEILESTLDESLIDEFKAKNFVSSESVNVVWHEVVVEDCIQVLEAIRGMENDYDLVMVGKRHSMGDFKEEEMSNFMDNADQLGVFGDMLASTEFCNGKAPVLVMQCGEKQVKLVDKLGPSHL